MRTVTFLGITFIAGVASFAAACGDSGTTTGTTSTASTSSSTTSSTSGSPTSTSSSTAASTGTTTSSSSGMGGAGGVGGAGGSGVGGAGGSGGSGPVPCTEATAEDHLKDANVDISFPGVALQYTPSCIKVSAGSSVTFNGNFVFHPLGGGSNPPTVDAASPIKETKTGMSAQFKLQTAGTFDYFCEVHYALGMKGTIIVK